MEAAAAIDREAALWEGHAALAVGLIVDRYLKSNPPPAGDRLGDDLEVFSAALAELGRLRLGDLRARPLRVV